jgi:hypothetical protein
MRLLTYLFWLDILIVTVALPISIVYHKTHVLKLQEEQAQQLVLAETATQNPLTYLEAPASPTFYAKPVPKPTPTKRFASITRILPVSTFAQSLTEILHKIAKCESNNNPLARNPTSSAKGLLQILDGTWKAFQCEGNVLNAEDNFQCGVKIASQSGLHHWNESKACWNKQLSLAQ